MIYASKILAFVGDRWRNASPTAANFSAVGSAVNASAAAAKSSAAVLSSVWGSSLYRYRSPAPSAASRAYSEAPPAKAVPPAETPATTLI